MTENLIAHSEESTVDPNIGSGYRTNLPHRSFRPRINNVKTRGRLHQQQRGNSITLPECVEHPWKRHIAQSVSIVSEKHLFTLHVGLYGLQTLPDVGIRTCLDKGNCPVVHVAV